MSSTFYKLLPKIELHAHLNGSLSRSTLLELQRYNADAGLRDKTDAFLDEFELGAGDSRNLSEVFDTFAVAHKLTTTVQSVALATSLTLKEFADDGCCYIELRSTPRNTEFMTKKQYIVAIIETMKASNKDQNIIACLIISINRIFTPLEAEEIVDLAIECKEAYPDIVVGIEISGNPTIGKFKDFKAALLKAKDASLKITLHCGEICNTSEILEMIEFKPDRLGHGVCIHPRLGGSDETWQAFCRSKIPIELCLTSNLKSKSIPDYESHHFKEFYEANIPLVLCTDDKGVFATCLSDEYKICAETFNLNKSKIAKIALEASRYIFSDIHKATIIKTFENYLSHHGL